MFLIALIMVPVGGGPAWAAWQKFTADQGLAPGPVLCSLEDRAENLWFGTQGTGVSRYDGVSWKTFTTTDGLVGNTVSAIAQDRSGNLWFGTRLDGVTPGAGVSRFDGANWTAFTTAHGLVDNEVSSILEDRSGNLWFGTSCGISRYDGSTMTSVLPWETPVSSILEDRAGNLWFASGSGVLRLEGSNWTRITTTDGLASNAVGSILQDRRGNLWFGTEGGGVSRLDSTGHWTTFTTAHGLGSNFVRSMFEDRRGRIWFGCTGNVLSRYDGQFRAVAHPMYGDWVHSITQDGSGNLWFGGYVEGVYRYDDSAWTTFTTADGLAHDSVWSLLEDRSGNLWFGCEYVGATRFDGSTWTTFTPDSGLGGDLVKSMLEDRSGNIWFTFWRYGRGVSRYDGSSWRTFTPADGLASENTWSLLEDDAGRVWVGTVGSGASVFEGSAWSPGPAELASSSVTAMLEDRSGRFWFGTDDGACSRYGAAMVCFTTSNGLAGNYIGSILEDHSGNLWFGGSGGVTRYDLQSWAIITQPGVPNVSGPLLEDRSGNLWFVGNGVSRFDGSEWRTLTSANGLAHDRVLSMMEDRWGNLWLGTISGVSRYEPDRVPPRTVFLVPPPRVSASRNQTAVFGAAFGEVQDLEFSHRFDGSAWSAWTAFNAWVLTDVPDGVHTLEVRARDYLTNMDSTAAVATFDVDATPPVPVLAAPSFGQAVRGSIEIRGTAADARFERYGVVVRRAGTSTWDSLVVSTTPVTDGLLATWDTSALPDGSYEIRLAVSDDLDLTGSAQVTVRVDNQAPYDEQTAPARVYAATGGDIYTTNGELHLYFPPHAFAADAQVTIEAADPAGVPETLASGATRVLAGYVVDWRGSSLEKPLQLELSLAGVAPGTRAGLALHYSSDGAEWQRLGGTVTGERLALSVNAAGLYALYDGGAAEGAATLSSLSFTPRVFSPTGGFANAEVGIGFTLGRSASVTVRVYNRAGRLMREVAAGQGFGPGANLVRWDGRDREGAVVADGIYLVTVEALGETRKQPLAVVR